MITQARRLRDWPPIAHQISNDVWQFVALNTVDIIPFVWVCSLTVEQLREELAQ